MSKTLEISNYEFVASESISYGISKVYTIRWQENFSLE